MAGIRKPVHSVGKFSVRRLGARIFGASKFTVVLTMASFAMSGCTIWPQALTGPERQAEAERDLAKMYGEQAPLLRPLTLHDAFARAVEYNLDGRVKLVEEALARDDFDLSRYDLLPKAYLNGAYTARNNQNASSSQSIANGATTVPPSISTDQIDRSADLLVSWNLLDFGVSYFAARQQADRVLIGAEERRKVIQTLFQDVRRAFWRAASAQRLNGQILAAISAAEAALPAARKVETEGLHSPVDSLRYQKALLDLIRQLESIQSVLAVSKTELAQLINLPPGQPYTLAVPGGMRINSVRIPIAQMEDAALLLNPDIRELSYQKRISVDETHKALLRLLPGITFSYDPSYDSNSFLVHHYWATGAVRIGGYLNGLLTFPSTYRRATNNEKLADLKREAMSMAVLAKLHIAYQQYLAASREFRRSQQVSDVDSRLYDQIRNRTATDVGGDLERISAQVSAVTSQLRSYQSYAEAQAALGRLYATLGIDPTPEHADMLDLAALGAAVRRGMDEHLAPVVPGTDPVLNAKAQATTAEATTAGATTTSVAAVDQPAAPAQQR